MHGCARVCVCAQYVCLYVFTESKLLFYKIFEYLNNMSIRNIIYILFKKKEK